MPRESGKPLVNTAPKPGLLRRLFGGPMSESTAQEWPQLAQEWTRQEFERPNETTMTNRVRPMNWYEKFASGDAHAVTWPWGTVALNKKAIEGDKADLGGILSHELTHIGQKPSIMRHLQNTVTNMASGLPYEERAEEQEAFAAEKMRPRRRKDIFLGTGPSPGKLAKLQGKSNAN